MDASAFIASIVGAAIGLAILYLIIKVAVRNGMREHQEWLDERAAAPAKDPARTDE